MNSHTKIMTWGIAGVVLTFIFLWITVYIERPSEDQAVLSPEQAADVSPQATSTGMVAYEDPEGRFSLSYPESYVREEGTVSFRVPTSLTEGTNLSSDSKVYVEVVPVATSTSTCSALSFVSDENLLANSDPEKKQVMFGGKIYDTLRYGGAGAGNFYETYVYAISNGDHCYGISQFIHSTNIANYEPGAVTEFDREAYDADVESILESFKML